MRIEFINGPVLSQELDILDLNQRSIFYVGTAGVDQFSVENGLTENEVIVVVSGLPTVTFHSTGRVIAHGGDGNDILQASGDFVLPVWFYGESGDDRLKGGVSHDILMGGSGDDLLVGKQGRDFLVGGNGADRIVGNADDDILISGILDFGETPIETAVSFVMQEWTSARSYGQRLLNLTDGSGTNDRENDNYFLKWMETVKDDQDKDTLTGSAGSDWFFANIDDDRITDLHDEAFADDFTFITS
ncbi:MAG: hypothetical protein KDB03_04420 [Planctomycetales bacterium]|nr:hypothetical protein [Planctomycetales bacterium]